LELANASFPKASCRPKQLVLFRIRSGEGDKGGLSYHARKHIILEDGQQAAETAKHPAGDLEQALEAARSGFAQALCLRDV